MSEMTDNAPCAATVIVVERGTGQRYGEIDYVFGGGAEIYCRVNCRNSIDTPMQLASNSVLKATCLCKSCTITLTGPPLRCHYCHCTICQKIHSAPYALIAVYLESNVTLPEDKSDRFATFSPKEGITVYCCRECGVSRCGWVGNYKVWGVYVSSAITMDGEIIRPMEFPEFEGVMHMFYQHRQRDVKFALPHLYSI